MGLEKRISPTMTQKWKVLRDERRALLKLLARFNLTKDQATRFFSPTDRERAGILITDTALPENPYLLYELDRFSQGAITIGTVDRGIFPDPVVREQHRLPPPSALDGPTDKRRVRALIVSVLETAAASGHTLQSQTYVLDTVRHLALDPPCPVDADLMTVVESHFAPLVVQVEMADGSPAYQLQHLSDARDIIRRAIERRMKGARLNVDADWAALLNDELPEPDPLDREAEQLARREKAAALNELAASRVSVLIGPAGTGKTTLLSILCNHVQLKAQGVTLLAPTGKARVQLEKATRRSAQTIAQFLLPSKRYDPNTGMYKLSTQETTHQAKTVIIDEASMLTEEQLAAILQVVRNADRLIFVGDPRQLPPIGSGRPFVDIVNRLEPPDRETRFPRVGAGYTELTVRRRQRGEERDDLLLADWFSGQSPGPGADEIWDRVAKGLDSKTLHFVAWTDANDIHEKILDVLAEKLGLDGRDDIGGFEHSYGGTVPNERGFVYFNRTQDDRDGVAEAVENWQILSPVRGQPHGTVDLNRIVQTHYRSQTIKSARSPYNKRIPKPFEPEGIVYGDKVMNTVNRTRHDVYPKDNGLHYVANGEIGVVTGQANWKGVSGRPWKLQVEFSSQAGFAYDYTSRDFNQEGDVRLELAYAITVHKAQGSEFGLTFLVVPNPARMLSRELLYTALTRQREQVVILHQGDLIDLKKFAVPSESETARRLTNLFSAPTPVPFGDHFLEENLIHRTVRGEAVRSKSEVIIANLLHAKGHEYEYEPLLLDLDGSRRYGDFLIEDPELGIKVYWEHLGRLDDPVYRARWQRKLDWYRTHGIVPREEGGGTAGTLIITRDDEHGGIDSAQISALIEEVFA